MVLVWVCEDHHVDAALPPRDPLAEPSQQQVRVGPAIDEHPRAGRRRDQDRVALPDVQRDEVQPAVRQGCEGQADEEGHAGRHAHEGPPEDRERALPDATRRRERG